VAGGQFGRQQPRLFQPFSRQTRQFYDFNGADEWRELHSLWAWLRLCGEIFLVFALVWGQGLHPGYSIRFVTPPTAYPLFSRITIPHQFLCRTTLFYSSDVRLLVGERIATLIEKAAAFEPELHSLGLPAARTNPPVHNDVRARRISR
jgi:hypothetical protein